ncbi:hypothetical protein BA768_05955 [Chryseobacterium sp. CBo1]|uniref:hypothetical protein n=1 Tax=Chryseobacterium sp. CBo1 TaxID=1869230 RepID=UPI0008105510|nr:hypothetical protein [Chryseobacterium sp. CBo1]OCK50169.1 hypothetical protein BA768_05955 [Chryseobacterium sp. CBo1]
MKPKKVPGIPSQVRGGFQDTESIKRFSSSEEVDFKFDILKDRFFEINNWNNYSQGCISKFELCDNTGESVRRSPKIGDYIKILLTKINNPEIEDYHWVQIDMIDKSNPNRIMLQCRPSKLPGNEFAGKTIHFHSAASTSTFVISKGNDYIKMAIYERNQQPNKNTSFANSIKNIVSSVIGTSKIQWKSLADGLININ